MLHWPINRVDVIPNSTLLAAHTASPFDEGHLLGLVHDAIIATTIDGVILTWNVGAERVYGYSASEIIGRNIALVYFAEDLALIPAGIGNPVQAAAGGKDLNDVTLRRRHKDGRPLVISLRISAIRDQAGAVAGFITCSSDITERKSAEDALRVAHAELERRVAERTRDLLETNLRLQGEIAERRRVEVELRTSRERLDHLLLSSPGVLYSAGIGGDFTPTFVSQNAASVFGYEARDFLTSPAFWLDHVHPAERSTVASFPGQTAREGQRCGEYRFLHGDGTWRSMRDSAVAVLDESGKPVEIVGSCLDITAEKKAQETRIERERLRFFAETLLATQEAERRRISLELHDDLNQRLAALILDIGMLQQNLPASAGLIRSRLTLLKDQAAEISDSVRAIALRLHSAGLEQFGLRAALEQECRALANRTRIRITFRGKSVSEALPENISLCLYRVAQECLQNLVRHSRAQRATVTLEQMPESVRLCVKDSGIGFDFEAKRGQKSLGLIGIHERVRLLNGVVTVDSRPGGGARIEVTVPLVNSQ